MSPDCLLGVVTQPTDSRLSEARHTREWFLILHYCRTACLVADKPKKKQKGGKKKSSKHKKTNSDDEALEESDDMNEGQEVDYMTDSDR